MTHPAPPTIAQTYATKRATFIRHVPFGVLLKDDLAALVKATARDCKCTVQDVLQEVVAHG
jgi:hypothetical protein